MACLSSFWKVVLVGFVLASSLSAAAEAPMCSLLGMPWAPFFLPTVVAEPVIGRLPMLLFPMVANLPFTADFSHSVVLPDGSEGDTFQQLASIARDRDGRVSMKSRAYRLQNADRMAFSMEICDPIAGTTTSFQACVDGANDATSSDGCAVKKVAHVRAGPHLRPDSGLPVFPDPFKPLPAHHSSAFVPRSGELVDLGEKDVEGVRVHGYRNVDGADHQNTCDGVPVSTSKEWWLSEKTGLAVSATVRTSANGESEEGPTSLPEKCLGGVTIELTNIQRVEPEPELFKMPPDYEIVPIDNTWKGAVPWKPTVKPQ
jgi:hypothetical protein